MILKANNGDELKIPSGVMDWLIDAFDDEISSAARVGLLDHAREVKATWTWLYDHEYARKEEDPAP